MESQLARLSASLSTPVERRLFAEYGAVFMTTATPPPVVIFEDQQKVQEFQSSVEVASACIGDYKIELQAEAMRSLLLAASEVSKEGARIEARSLDAGRRSFEETESLWIRNVSRGIDKWVDEGRLTRVKARSILDLPVLDQVNVVLDLEGKEGLYFGTYFDKSILSSVAAPGASQHLSMLAFDVSDYSSPAVELAMTSHGWHRTVVGDLPHFTYLGHDRRNLISLGLRREVRTYGSLDYEFWIPDI